MKKKQGNQKRGCGGKKNSVQELLSIQYFTKYGLMTEHGEMVFFQIAPTNISVLSYENIERKINHLQGLISMHPDLEIVCTDSCECFDGNREYLRRRASEESNRQVRSILEKDREMLSQMQSEMSNARQFYLVMGVSVQELANFMNDTAVWYDPNKPWNKNMVARILADTRYLGESGFPVLVDASVFLNTEEKRKKKAPAVQKTEAQTVLRRKCGFRITPHIEHEVLYLLNCLAMNPERIVTPKIPRAHSQRLDILKFELEGLIGQLPVDENRAHEVLREIAAEMYADVDPREYETQRLRRLFQKEVPSSELDANLIAMSISAVLVDGNGNVKIRLKNDQIVERGEQNG